MYRRIVMRLNIVLLLSALVFSGCARPTPEPTEAPTEAAPEATEAPTEAAPEEEAACSPSTVADPMGVPEGKWPQQYTQAEYEELAGCQMTFSSREQFDPRLWEIGKEFFGEPHLKGDLPPVEERLPEEPLVVQPYEEIGNYGGRARYMSYGPESGDSGFLSVRHVNLVRYLDDCKTIVPWAAKHFEVSDDYKTITFWLRKGHKWSDGELFTVDDIVFWWEDILLNEDLFPEVPSQWVFGGEPMEIEKIDDVTFNIHLAAPVADSLLSWMAKTWIQMWAPKHAFKEYHPGYNPDIRETAKEEGFEDWKDFFFVNCYSTWRGVVDTLGLPELESHVLVEETTDYQIFAANPYFFMVDTAGNQLPYIDELYLTWGEYATFEQNIIAGEVDYKGQNLGVTSMPLFKKHMEDGDYSVQLSPSVILGPQITFNCTHKDPVLRDIFQNPKFSEAMSLAINRQEICDTVYFGLCEPQQHVPVHPSASFAKAEWYAYKTEYDPERAKELLDEIGLDEKDAQGRRLRPDGKRLVIENVYCEQGANSDTMELLVEYWGDVGVETKMKNVSTEAYRTLVSQNKQDVATFTSGTTWEPVLHANPYRLMPPFGDAALEPLCGLPWREWWESGGEAGEEPPEDVKELFDLVLEWKGLRKGTEEYEELGQRIIEVFRDHFWHIGLHSDTLRPTVIHNRLANVPKITYQAWDLYRTYPYRSPQWFIKKEYLEE